MSQNGLLAGGDYDVEYRIAVAGEIRWLRSVARVEPAREGRPARILGTPQELTPLQRLRQDLERRQKIHSAIVSSSPVSVLLLDARTLAFLEFNDTACFSLGYTREAFAALTASDPADPDALAGIREIERRNLDGELSTLPLGNEESIRQAALLLPRLRQQNGLTEAFRSTYLPPSELDRRPTSMGKAIPDTEIVVVNEHGQECKPSEIGELVHRGPTVSMGYWGNPEATAKVLRVNPLAPPELGDQERVCYSGDLVKKDEDGFLYYVGRRDTMIKCSGHRISPTEVEEVLFQSGQVRQAAVIGVPDEVMGQVIKAFVVARDGNQVEVPKLLAFCGEKVPRYMVPRHVDVLDELPKTTSGKVDYPALRRREGL